MVKAPDTSVPTEASSCGMMSYRWGRYKIDEACHWMRRKNGWEKSRREEEIGARGEKLPREHGGRC